MYYARTLEPEASASGFSLLFDRIVLFIESAIGLNCQSLWRKYLISLPIRHGGLGLVDLSLINTVAFRVSLFNCSALCGSFFHLFDLSIDDCYNSFNSLNISSLSLLPKKSQWFLCDELYKSYLLLFKKCLPSHLINDFASQCVSGSGSFLFSLPSGNGCFNNSEFKQFFKWRLLDFNFLPICPLCGFKNLTDCHLLACRNTSQCVIGRHNSVRDSLINSFNVKSDDVEKPFKNDQLIVDFVYNNIGFDVTVVGANNHSVTKYFSDARNRKLKKYQCLVSDGLIDEFVPLIFNVFGGLDFSTKKIISHYGGVSVGDLNALILRGSYRCWLAYRSIMRGCC
ncbi:hypothetical protein RCL1_003572 [Eukaryota sp. TZLM3-RCL]